ncbi:MAG: PhzF family phenazine biosynthesis protein [Thermomicrobiaceae bacterium]
MTRIRQIDAFTSVPFKGNPAGVCILEAPADAAWMQSVAAEMNVAETAFIWPEGDAFRLRWFTPATEVELCGHATLASAHALWESGTLSDGQQAVFNTLSGRLTAVREGDWIVLDFPVESSRETLDTDAISAAIGTDVLAACCNRFDFLAEVASAAQVRDLEPDLRAISALDCRGLIVTATSDDARYDFVSRFFGPAVGVDEDPVTGSAHCFLGPYWADRLGRTELTGYQASARGGVVNVALHGDRVRLKGQAVTVLVGELTG